jgi:hypothetical protein
MQKSENKIKPMYFWSDGYKEHGILDPDYKKIKKEELSADISDTDENEFVFESSAVKVTNRQTKRRKLRNFLKSEVQRALRYARFYRGREGANNEWHNTL